MADRIKVFARKGYTVLQNDMILDKRLSLKTKGLMAVLLSRPDGWEFSVAGLAAFCGCGKDAIRGALKELERAGYLTRQQLHGEGGTFGGNLYVIQESSLSPMEEETPLSGKPSSGKPSSGKPSSENPTERNKDLKKEGLKEPPIVPQGRRRVPHEPKWKPEAFDKFWGYYSAHARKENRAEAVKEWDKLKPNEDLIRTMGMALMSQVNSDLWRRGVGIPYACRWLKNRRWEDVSPGGETLPSDELRVEERGLPVW